MNGSRLRLSPDFKFLIACMVLSAVAFPLGILLWTFRRRHRLYALAGVAMTIVTGAVSAMFFAALHRAVGLSVRWYEPLAIGNVLALLFLGSRSPEPIRLTRARAVGYYGAFALASLGLWLLPITARRLDSQGAAFVETGLLAGSVLLWEALFWAFMVFDPPVTVERGASVAR